MDLDSTTLSELSQAGKGQVPNNFTNMRTIKSKNKINEQTSYTNNRLVVSRGERRWREGKMHKGGQVHGD